MIISDLYIRPVFFFLFHFTWAFSFAMTFQTHSFFIAQKKYNHVFVFYFCIMLCDQMMCRVDIQYSKDIIINFVEKNMQFVKPINLPPPIHPFPFHPSSGSACQ